MIFRTALCVALTLVLFVGAPILNAKDADRSSHEGKFVSLTGSKLVMTGKDGKIHAHTLAADAKVSCDGKACKSEDLKPGMRIRVTTLNKDMRIATLIEALVKHDDSVVSHDGKVISIVDSKLVMANKKGKMHSHILPADVKVSCDGTACKVEDLKPGMKIRVTTTKDGKHAVIRIEALDKGQHFTKRD